MTSGSCYYFSDPGLTSRHACECHGTPSSTLRRNDPRFDSNRVRTNSGRIARILGTLDDKIELNRRMSETLEAIARALFKSWFVDFEPVHAKAEGRDPASRSPSPIVPVLVRGVGVRFHPGRVVGGLHLRDRAFLNGLAPVVPAQRRSDFTGDQDLAIAMLRTQGADLATPTTGRIVVARRQRDLLLENDRL